MPKSCSVVNIGDHDDFIHERDPLFTANRNFPNSFWHFAHKQPFSPQSLKPDKIPSIFDKN